MKILIVAHGHPSLRAGGAERAAYSMFEEFKKLEGVEATFLATVQPEAIGHDGAFGAFRGRHDELLFAPPLVDGFRLSTMDYQLLEMRLRTVLDYVQPDIVHFHHYLSTGFEAFEITKRVSHAEVYLTLHEFMSICLHNGQMVKKPTLKLCNRSSPSECHACFPEHSSGKFFLRRNFIEQHMVHVDGFIAPSEFLRTRYLEWGLAPDRIRTIENFLPSYPIEEVEQARGDQDERTLRLGYFGQLTPYKGADVLLEALSVLDKTSQRKIELVVFGAQLEDQPKDFREKFMELLGNSRVKTSFLGSYQNEDVVHLMQSVDFVVVPSIWWENSPLVIQEAKAAGTPLIVSNIGGMKEKVRSKIDGFHFQARSAFHLSELLSDIVKGKWRRVSPLDVDAQNAEVLQATLDMYGFDGSVAQNETEQPIAFASA